MTSGTLARGSLRFYRRHCWQTLLILAGIAMGVTVVVAVDMANQSARRALALSVEAVAGGSSHRIVGGPGGLSQSLITGLRRDLGIHASAPVITDYVSLDRRTFTLLGVDPVSEIALERYAITGDGGAGIGDMLLSSGVFMSAAAGADLMLETGDDLILDYRGRTLATHLGGLIPGETIAEGLLIADIVTAQVLLGRGDTLDRVDLRLKEGDIQRLKAWLPPGNTLVESDSRDRSLKQMTDTFHLNLTAMSLLALLVGGLLIYNTMAFAVLQRRRIWGICRGLGTTRSELMGVILRESLVLGLAGTAAGLVAGIGLASVLVRLVLRTVDDLYFVLTVTGFQPDYLSLGKGALLGVGVSVVAALVPAWQAGRANPGTLLRGGELDRGTRSRAPGLFAGGVVLLAAGTGLAAVEEQSLEAGLLALALQVIGFCGLVPGLVSVAVAIVVRVGNPVLGPAARLALLGIRAGLSRTGMAVAALTVAVAATVGMGIMVTSFRDSLETWLEQTLRGDIQVSTTGSGSGRAGPGLPPDFIARVAELGEVTRLQASRFVTVESGIGELEIVATGPSREGVDAFPVIDESLLIARPGQDIHRAFRRGEGILISEPLARHHDLAPGDTLEFSTAIGGRELTVLGVFRDYRSTRGMAMVALETYRRLWNDDGVSALTIYTGSDVRQQVLEQLRSMAAGLEMRLNVSSSAEIRVRSLEVFEQTFAVTRALRLLTVVVAFVGVFGALMLLHLERLRHLAILRAVGMTSRQVAGLVMIQTGAMGLLSGLLSLPLGLLMARVLIHVINVRAFGWTLGTTLPAGVFADALLLATGAALLAGIYPAYRLSTVEPARVMRDE